MAILVRKGSYIDFDPQKMLPGEWACVLVGDSGAKDGRSIYMCFSAGDVKRMATYEDMVENINLSTKEIQEMFTEQVRQTIQEALEKMDEMDTVITNAQEALDIAIEEVNAAIEDADKATQSANTAADSANTAAGAANSAANSANTAASEANSAAQRTETAIENAETAAETANGAAQRVETAIETANTAANSANTAAGAANTAAGAANSAASDADSAAQEAREAAERANEAAQEIEGAVSGIINDTTPSANTTYSSQKIESIKTAMQETIPPKENILANANFAAGIINTRGKSSYTSANAATGKTDMIDGWSVINSASGATKLEVQSGKIALTTNKGNAFFQYIRTGVLQKDKKYLLTASINGVIQSVLVNPVQNSQNDKMFCVLDDGFPGFSHRVGFLASGMPMTVEWAKIEEGTEFTGMPQYNGQLETLKAGTYTPINNLNATVPGHPLDAMQGARLSVWLKRMMNVYVGGGNTFKFRASYSSTDQVGSRQSVFIFGMSNNIGIGGIIVIKAGSSTCDYVSFTGSNGNLTATLSGEVVTVTLPSIAFDLFTLISGYEISGV